MSAAQARSLVVHGWTVFAQPLFLNRQVGLRRHPARPDPYGVPARLHVGRRSQALVAGEILPAVPALLPLPRSEQANRVRLGQ